MSKVTQDEQLLENVLFGKFHFFDDLGSPQNRSFQGTLFTVAHGNEKYLVTNRHNVDFTLIDENKVNARLMKVEVTYRWRFDGQSHETSVVEIPEGTPIYVDDNKFNDVAVIDISDVKLEGVKLSRANINIISFLEKDNFDKHAQYVDQLNFIGFPCNFWDQENHLPITREAMISSIPNLNYSGGKLPLADRILVSGLSFSGSSGSLVTNKRGAYMGVMAGHYELDNVEGLSQFQKHAGLSFFIKGYVIRNIIKNKKTFVWGGNWDAVNERWED